jgi:SAM-dependent methyltransferase
LFYRIVAASMHLDPESILICPICHTSLERDASEAISGSLHCPVDHLQFKEIDGIWRMLSPEAIDRLGDFIRSYEHVRMLEGRGSTDAEFYRSLPYARSIVGEWRKHWKLRAHSYERLLAMLAEEAAVRLTIIDVGSGNSWLSNRLAEAGHNMIAVDLQTNDFDGLGCRKFYNNAWLSVQAEFDSLPFPDSLADIVVFNASVHYSHNLTRSLGEAKRVLKPTGLIVVLDTPIYLSESSGRKMLAERSFPVLGQIGFLTPDRLDAATKDLALTWTGDKTSGFSLARLVKKLYLGREPARLSPIRIHRQS